MGVHAGIPGRTVGHGHPWTAFIVVPITNVISPPDYYQAADIRANPLFWIAVAAIFGLFGLGLIYRAIQGPRYGKGRN